MTENIVHRISEHAGEATRKERALAAAVEVGRPIAFATLIVIAVFFPLFAMTGIEGRMYSPLAAAVIAAIAASLVLALTMVPVVASLFLRPRPQGKPEDVWIIRELKRYYAPLLDASLRNRKLVLLVSVLIVAPAILLAFHVGSDFMPKLDEGAFLIETFLPPKALPGKNSSQRDLEDSRRV